MAPSRTRTMKNKHAAPKGGGHTKGGGVTKRSSNSSSAVDTSAIRKPKSAAARPSAPPKQVKDKTSVRALLQKSKKKKKTYTAAELGIPALNMVTPVGVVKPKGKKKGKIFADDRESMNTILSIVQAEKNGQIESKMIKARQMEEIREARRVEAEKNEEVKKSKLEDVKDSLRRKRNKTTTTTTKNDADDDNIKDLLYSGTKAKKTSKKRVSFV